MAGCKKLFLAVVVLCASAFAQNALVPVPPVFLGPATSPRLGANLTIFFCTSAATLNNCLAGSAYAQAYADSTNSNPINQATTPLKTDALGNAPAFFGAPGLYSFAVNGPGIGAPQGPYQITVSCIPGTTCVAAGANNAFTGNNTHSGTETFTNGISTNTAAVTGALTATGNIAFSSTSGTSKLSTDGSNNFPHTFAGIDVVHNPAANSGGCSGAGVYACYPAGNDLFLQDYGPADTHLINCAEEVTSTTSVGGAGTVTVTVGSPTECGAALGGNPTAMFSFPNGAAGLTICGTTSCNPNTDATSENVSSANYSIASGTTLTITFAKAHTQPYKIRQQGALGFQGGFATFNTDPTSGLTEYTFQDQNSTPLVAWPNNTVNTWPLGGIRFNMLLTGTNGPNQNLVFRQNNAASHWQFFNAANSSTLIDMDNTGLMSIQLMATNGTITLPNAVALRGKDNGGTARNLLQRFSDNKTYLEGGASGFVLRDNDSGTTTLTTDGSSNLTINRGPIAGGSAAGLAGTGACATITTQVGGSWGGSAKCTGTTGASTLTITPGTTAPNGWTCNVQDETTRANVFQQTSHTTTTCVLTVTSVTQNDVFVFSALPF